MNLYQKVPENPILIPTIGIADQNYLYKILQNKSNLSYTNIGEVSNYNNNYKLTLDKSLLNNNNKIICTLKYIFFWYEKSRNFLVESEENEIIDNREIEEGKHYNSNEIEILYDINIPTEENSKNYLQRYPYRRLFLNKATTGFN